MMSHPGTRETPAKTIEQLSDQSLVAVAQNPRSLALRPHQGNLSRLALADAPALTHAVGNPAPPGSWPWDSTLHGLCFTLMEAVVDPAQ